jgi:hypothetical protein
MDADDPTVTAPHIQVLADALPTLNAVESALAEADAFGEAMMCSGLILLIESIVATETVQPQELSGTAEGDVRLSPDGSHYMMKGGDA